MAERQPVPVVLTEEERTELLSWARSRNCSQALALRARILLACDGASSNKVVAEQLGVSVDMVRKWRSRFAAEGLAGLTERSRPGRPAHVGDAVVTDVLIRLLSAPPSGRRWSTRSMATAVGASQATVSRIWRAYRLMAPPEGLPGAHGLLPPAARDVVGLFVGPSVRVLAVAAAEQVTSPLDDGRSTAVTPSMRRRTAQARDIFAVADAFAQFSERAAGGTPRVGTALRGFLERLERSVPASMTVHLLVDGLAAADEHVLENWLRAHSRFRRHVVTSRGAWLEEIDALLARHPLPSQDNVLGYAASLTGLREDLRRWCEASKPPVQPFAWIKSPRSLWRGDRDYRSLINDSNSHNDVQTGVHVVAEDGAFQGSGLIAPRIADRVAELVREELTSGRFKPGERVKEAPLAARLGVSRGPVREALRVLAEEGMLELLPNRGVAVPPVNAENIIDLYALRASVGGLLMRRIAMRPRTALESVAAALAEVRSVARNEDHAQIGEADLRFQDEIARTAQLPQAGVIFERLSMRLRMFNSVLQLDWAEAVDLIARENVGLYEAIRSSDGDEAARRWRVKVERSVRYMVAQLPQDHFDPQLWVTLAGKPSLRRGDPRGVH